MNDIERARAAQAAQKQQQDVDRVADMARDVLNNMNPTSLDYSPSELITALLLAVLAAADQLGIPRDTVVDCLKNMAATVQLRVQ